MKNKTNIIINILMYMPMVVVIIALFYLPDSIPAHYGDDFIVDRWGSKYEVLIYGVIPIIFGYIMKNIAQTDEIKSNKMVRAYGGIIGLSVFNIIIVGLIYNAFRLTSASAKMVAINLSQIILVALGISLILIGNIMPKTKRNKISGVRYSGDNQDEKRWNIRQRVGGLSMMSVGIAIVAINLFCKNNSVIILISIIGLMLLIPMIILLCNRVKKNKEM